jgi:CRP-like cAMP-binding protein
MVITPREYLMRAGEVVHSMYFVISGNLRVLDGEGNIVATVHEGGVIGEVGIILNTTAVCDVQTTSTCELFRLTREDYETILKVCTLILAIINNTHSQVLALSNSLKPLDPRHRPQAPGPRPQTETIIAVVSLNPLTPRIRHGLGGTSSQSFP